MFRPMRRLEKQMSEEETRELLISSDFGILSIHGEDGFPYGVPVNHILMDKTIYIHSAMEGHKISALVQNPKASYTVIGQAEVIPETFETFYESAVAFGQVRLLDAGEEKMKALHGFIDRFSSEFKTSGNEYVEKNAPRTMIIALDLIYLTGKRGR